MSIKSIVRLFPSFNAAQEWADEDDRYNPTWNYTIKEFKDGTTQVEVNELPFTSSPYISMSDENKACNKTLRILNSIRDSQESN